MVVVIMIWIEHSLLVILFLAKILTGLTAALNKIQMVQPLLWLKKEIQLHYHEHYF